MADCSCLNLEATSFSNVDLKYLCISLYNDISVYTLNLGYCSIDDYCAIELAELLSRNKTIRYLEITGNYITTGGAIAIAKALIKNTTLTTLSLSYNLIDSFTEFSKYLLQNTTLTRIEINGNVKNKYSEYYYDVIFNIMKRNNIYLRYKPSLKVFRECSNLPDELYSLVVDKVFLQINKTI